MQAKVSIVIPTYNREKLIRRCIESALRQTYENIEVIAVDNCSTDNTWQVLGEYAAADPRVKIFRNEQNLGPVKNWARGISEATGEYLKILWSDDWIDEDFIAETLPLLENDPEAGFVYTPTFVHTANATHMLYCAGRGRRHRLESLIDSFLFGWFQHPSSPGNAIFRTVDVKANLMVDIPNEYGLDFNRYGAGNDRMIFMRCFPKYRYFHISQRALSHFLSHDESFTASNDLAFYYHYSVKYFVENFLNERKFRRRFNCGLLWLNCLNRDKYKQLYLAGESRLAPFTLLRAAAGYGLNLLRQSLAWYCLKR